LAFAFPLPSYFRIVQFIPVPHFVSIPYSTHQILFFKSRKREEDGRLDIVEGKER
jgi:hypothetical protein